MRNAILTIMLTMWLTACGGGGPVDNNPDPGKPGKPVPGKVLQAGRYLPSETGKVYTYQPGTILAPLAAGETGPMVYTVEPSPFGNGVYYNLTETKDARTGPVLDGSKCLGLAGEYSGETRWNTVPSLIGGVPILPGNMALGESWEVSTKIGNPGDPYLPVSGTCKLAAVETVTVRGNTYADCLRIDVAVNYMHPSVPVVLTGSYWLCPDTGLVKAVAKVAGIEAASVELVSVR